MFDDNSKNVRSLLDEASKAVLRLPGMQMPAMRDTIVGARNSNHRCIRVFITNLNSKNRTVSVKIASKLENIKMEFRKIFKKT